MDKLRAFFNTYGLAFVMVASYFGSGSIFIASSAGVRYGYTLIWAFVVASLFGFMAQDMSARLGLYGTTLMQFVRRKLGQTGALILALLLTTGCVLWCLELTAAAGKGVEVLLGGAITWQPLAVVCGALAIFVGIVGYDAVEKIMTAMMAFLLVAYVAVALASGPSVTETAAGFIPQVPGVEALTLAAGILGTTALWPNFFLQSILVRAKGWGESDEGLREMRTDLAIGYGLGGVTTVAVVVAAAAVLRPAGYTELESFLTPGLALSSVLGEWAMVVFLIGAAAAAFNSIVPIMWAPTYMILEALGRGTDAPAEDATAPGEARAAHSGGMASRTDFKVLYSVLVAIGSLSPVVHAVFGLSVVEMIILFPAYNGAFCLPVTAALLFWAVNDRTVMGHKRNTWQLNAANALLVVLSIYLSVTSAQGVLNALAGGGL